MSLFDPIVRAEDLAAYLDSEHYLGRAQRGFGWSDDYGVIVFANPNSRRLPQDRWLELIRWCLVGVPNGGSRQWADVSKWLRANRPDITTVVSYSDPSVGHTGALYRACNWIWAPTWHRLEPPPTGNGSWVDGEQQSVKDRWVFPLQKDPDRERLLSFSYPALAKRHPEAEYREPKRFR